MNPYGKIFIITDIESEDQTFICIASSELEALKIMQNRGYFVDWKNSEFWDYVEEDNFEVKAVPLDGDWI